MFVDSDSYSALVVDDNKSFVNLFREYSPLVKSRALLFCNSDTELDDLIQEGNIGLFYASMHYDCKLSAFTTYATHCIDASIIDYLRKTSKISCIPSNLFVDIDNIQILDFTSTPERTADAKDEFNQVILKAKRSFSKFEFSVFSEILRGFSAEEISSNHNVSVKSVYNCVQRIRNKLKVNMPK